eukprot:TRINITY_DN53036_c0_g1_i1.p1 TRINITY_DN53036_c0_g1~~TRINITY_DN53036_c0_g1_i1.p1  ORF type:complete len:172 (+),score=38.48 TRINITY_DN53036_c0_g1_i1:102-617(+)
MMRVLAIHRRRVFAGVVPRQLPGLQGRGFADATPASSSSTPSTPTPSTPAPAPAPAATPAEKPSGKFTGASATDAFASVAHAGFEVGSEGRFGYSPKYAASWDRIFGNKKKQEQENAAAAAAAAKTPAPAASEGLGAALAADSVLPKELKSAISSLNSEQLAALAKVLESR